MFKDEQRCWDLISTWPWKCKVTEHVPKSWNIILLLTTSAIKLVFCWLGIPSGENDDVSIILSWVNIKIYINRKKFVKAVTLRFDQLYEVEINIYESVQNKLGLHTWSSHSLDAKMSTVLSQCMHQF